MMKFLLILLLFSPVNLFADFECKQSLKPQGDELASLQLTYQNLNSFQADFKQKSFLSSLGIEEISQGEIFVAKPNYTKWIYLQPEKNVYLIKDQDFWHYQSAISQLTKSKLEKSNLSSLPTDLLTGQVSFNESFDLSLLCLNNAGQKLLNLIPQSSQVGSSNVKLVLNKAGRIKAVEFLDQAANVNIIELLNISWNPELDKDKVFQIDYPSETFITEKN